MSSPPSPPSLPPALGSSVTACALTLDGASLYLGTRDGVLRLFLRKTARGSGAALPHSSSARGAHPPGCGGDGAGAAPLVLSEGGDVVMSSGSVDSGASTIPYSPYHSGASTIPYSPYFSNNPVRGGRQGRRGPVTSEAWGGKKGTSALDSRPPREGTM